MTTLSKTASINHLDSLPQTSSDHRTSVANRLDCDGFYGR
jgi:hypothetical protein